MKPRTCARWRRCCRACDIREVSDYGNTNGEVSGVPPHYNAIRYLPLAAGRWLNDDDESQKRMVAVIGDEMLKNLFPGGPAVGNSILLNGIRFEVIGVVQRVGHGDDNSTNNRVFLPFSTMRQFFPLTRTRTGRRGLLHQLPSAGARRTRAWRARKCARSSPAIMDSTGTTKTPSKTGTPSRTPRQWARFSTSMDMFLGGVGLVTLTLGAIGIINIMLVAVSERTREIGLRKALGATNRSILLQFFLEGAFLTLMSGGIGMGGAALLMAD